MLSPLLAADPPRSNLLLALLNQWPLWLPVAFGAAAIYFLLPAGTFSAFHRVTSDEVWHHYDGDALELYVVDAHGVPTRHVLGTCFAEGELPQVVVPAGAWQAARPLGERYTLCGCTVSPGFDFQDFTLGTRAELSRVLPGHSALVERFTRD